MKEEFYFYKPSLLLRVKAMMIDSFIIVILMMIATFLLNTLNIQSGLVRGIFFVLIFLYEPIFVSFNRTLGQKIMGLRVLKYNVFTENGVHENISIFSSIFRYVFKYLLGWISLLLIHSDKYGQAIHDKIGNSVMTLD
jgi:uncharacterized RDD family membrane protein YckC